MFKKNTYISLTENSSKKPEVPEGLLKKCNACKSAIFAQDVKNADYICPKCHNYFRIHARHRIEMVADEGSFEEWNTDLVTRNPLHYKGYEEKIKMMQEKTGLDEAVLTGSALVHGIKAAIGVCDSRFIMASMGEVVGEKITRMVERATEEKLPVILFACSGGARMQEGIVSLMQMAKTSAALKRHSDAGLLYISVLTNPTTGGVTASFAMLGDVILAEPGALIGFAGPRVIQQTIGQKLPEGFQRAEFLLEHGFVDRIVRREEMKQTLEQILRLHQRQEVSVDTCREKWCGIVENVREERLFCGKTRENEKTPWETVLLSRRADRPTALDYIERIFDGFMEFHGDRYYGDDGAVVGGIASFCGIPVTVIGQQKGKTTKENIHRNFGMPSPEGYRKALRLMKQAEQFHRPVICLVDTPGAFCGIEAEERGQGEAIARNLFEMSDLKVPVLSIVIGEGGSGGALAMAVANEVWMMEHAIYSILSPEGFASILWKDSKKAPQAAQVMKVTAKDLLELGMIEQIIPEPEPVTLENLDEVSACLKVRLHAFLQTYENRSPEELTSQRYERFRKC